MHTPNRGRRIIGRPSSVGNWRSGSNWRSLYHYIYLLDERWSDAVQSRTAAVGDEESQSLLRLYRRWLAPAEHVLASAKTLQSQGYSVNGLEAFRKAFGSARTATTLDVAAMQAAYAELDSGGGRPLEEVVDEIRRRHVNKGP